MNNPIVFLTVGVFVGIYSGVMGLGGGTVMIPIMVLLLGLTQKEANATSLAVMLPPVMLPAIIQFYRNGLIKVNIACWMAVGVVAGSILGWKVASMLDDYALKLVFGFVLMYIAGYTIFNTFGPQHLVRSMLLAGIFALLAAAAFLTLRYLEAKPA
jgi:uncharacterized membrane protein YfcA